MSVSKKYSVKRIVMFLGACALFAASANVRAAGELDPTFGDEGKVLTAISGQDYGKNTIIQPDGKILVAGGSSTGDVSRVALVRFNPDGSLDSTFDNDGKTTASISDLSAIGWALALQPDGKIVVSGDGVGNGNECFFVIRFNQNGSLDTGFGNGGKVINDFLGNSALLRTVAIQADGKIVVAGTISSQTGGTDQDAVVIRYNSNGSLDAGFGNGGIVVTDITTGTNDYISGLLLQPDGKIIITGASGNTGDGLFNGKFAVVRYLPNGQLDSSFGNAGKIVFPFGADSSDQCFAATLQTDGKILLAGTTFSGRSFELAVIRLNSNGSPDASFGANGRTSMLINNRSGVTPQAVKVQSNGKIVVAGNTSAVSFVSLDFATVRFNPNGTLDTTFNGVGYNVTNIVSGSNDGASGLAIQTDGKIIVAGQTYTGGNGGSIVVLRYQGDSPAAARPTQFDYDGDGKSDLAVFRQGAWFVSNSSDNSFRSTQFGFGSDKITPADFDGDGKTDIAVFRDGDWYILKSSDNSYASLRFGQAGDVSVSADYDGDGKSDAAVFRGGVWYVLNSSNNAVRSERFGLPTDKPIVGDFDGDGKSDLAVYRGGTWYLQDSQAGYKVFQFGLPTDQPVAADYNGDGKTDAAVYRDGTWFIANSGGSVATNQFGLPTDQPVPADYDGDGKTDVAVFRNGTWFRLNSSNNAFVATQFGTANDLPIEAAFMP